MSLEENKQVITAFNEAMVGFFQTGDLGSLEVLFSPDCVFGLPGMPPDREGMMQALPGFQAALTNFQATVGPLVAEDDRVAYTLTWTATHSGELMGVPASGKHLRVTETHIERVRDGKIIEHGGDWDMLGLLQQVGAIPTM